MFLPLSGYYFGLQASTLGEPAGEVFRRGHLVQESPSTFRYVFLGHGTQALLLVEPAGERAPGAQAMHDLPFRYVLMGHLSLQVKSPTDPAEEKVP